jgi:hypothetical protein
MQTACSSARRALPAAARRCPDIRGTGHAVASLLVSFGYVLTFGARHSERIAQVADALDLACAGNFIRPGESSCMWISAAPDELVSPGGPACCGMIGCAASTGLPGCDERVRVTAAASGERPGQGGGDPGAASPDRGAGAAAGHDPARGSPWPTGRSWPPCCTGSRGTCSAGSGC